MKKKERIAQLEKELEELKQRVVMLEIMKVVGVEDKEINKRKTWPRPEPIPTYPYTTPAYPWGVPIITWNNTTNKDLQVTQ